MHTWQDMTPHDMTWHDIKFGMALLYITSQYIEVQYITLHYIELHYITLNYITLHYTRLDNIDYIRLHYIIAVHHYSTSLHYIIALHGITRHNTKLCYTTLDYITLHYITRIHTRNRITLHYITVNLIRWHWNIDVAVTDSTLHLRGGQNERYVVAIASYKRKRCQQIFLIVPATIDDWPMSFFLNAGATFMACNWCGPYWDEMQAQWRRWWCWWGRPILWGWMRWGRGGGGGA